MTTKHSHRSPRDGVPKRITLSRKWWEQKKLGPDGPQMQAIENLAIELFGMLPYPRDKKRREKHDALVKSPTFREARAKIDLWPGVPHLAPASDLQVLAWLIQLGGYANSYR